MLKATVIVAILVATAACESSFPPLSQDAEEARQELIERFHTASLASVAATLATSGYRCAPLDRASRELSATRCVTYAVSPTRTCVNQWNVLLSSATDRPVNIEVETLLSCWEPA